MSQSGRFENEEHFQCALQIVDQSQANVPNMKKLTFMLQELFCTHDCSITIELTYRYFGYSGIARNTCCKIPHLKHVSLNFIYSDNFLKVPPGATIADFYCTKQILFVRKMVLTTPNLRPLLNL